MRAVAVTYTRPPSTLQLFKSICLKIEKKEARERISTTDSISRNWRRRAEGKFCLWFCSLCHHVSPFHIQFNCELNEQRKQDKAQIQTFLHIKFFSFLFISSTSTFRCCVLYFFLLLFTATADASECCSYTLWTLFFLLLSVDEIFSSSPLFFCLSNFTKQRREYVGHFFLQQIIVSICCFWMPCRPLNYSSNNF